MYPSNKTNYIYNTLEVTPIDITIATSHFESLFDPIHANTDKIEQYIYANNILNKLYDEGNPVILCSDTNLLQITRRNIFSRIIDGKMYLLRMDLIHLKNLHTIQGKIQI